MIQIHHLETDLTQACQLSCVACNHHVPLYRVQPGGPKMASVDQILIDLGHLSKVLHADVWGALGGEPTLHPQLPRILDLVRFSGICDRIEVWTNGISLRKLPDVFWRSEWDEIVLSRYEGKLTDDHVQWIHERVSSVGRTLRVMDERQTPNFKTLFEPVPTDAATTRSKFAGCFFRHFSRVLNNGYFFTCCCAPHMPVLVQGRPFGTDGIAVADITEEKLYAYLTRRDPLGACEQCAGRDTAKDLKWREESRPLEWLRASAGLPLEGAGT